MVVHQEAIELHLQNHRAAATEAALHQEAVVIVVEAVTGVVHHIRAAAQEVQDHILQEVLQVVLQEVPVLQVVDHLVVVVDADSLLEIIPPLNFIC